METLSDRLAREVLAPKRRKGTGAPRPAIPNTTRDEIRAKRLAGRLIEELATEYGITKSTVRRIIADPSPILRAQTTREDWETFKSLRDQGLSVEQIRRKTGWGVQTIRRSLDRLSGQ